MKFMSFYSQGMSQGWVGLRLEASLYLKGVVFWSNCHNNFGKSEEMKVDDFSFQNTPFTPYFGVYASVWMDFLRTFWVLWGLFQDFEDPLRILGELLRSLRAFWGPFVEFEDLLRTLMTFWGLWTTFWGIWGLFWGLFGGLFESFGVIGCFFGLFLPNLRNDKIANCCVYVAVTRKSSE